jgi:hypothetical protein
MPPRALVAFATLVLVVALVCLSGKSPSETAFQRQPAPSAEPARSAEPIPSAPLPNATPPHEPTARDLRRSAFIAYEDDRWAECLEYLDKARLVDPAGDTTEKVQTARRFSELQLRQQKSAPKRGPP